MLTFINWNPIFYNPPFLTISRNFKIKCRFVGRNARLWPSMYTNEGKKIYKWLHSSETNFFSSSPSWNNHDILFLFFFLVKRVKNIAKLSLYWIATPFVRISSSASNEGVALLWPRGRKTSGLLIILQIHVNKGARSFCWVVGKHGKICQKVHH